jgi:hypothetical protein
MADTSGDKHAQHAHLSAHSHAVIMYVCATIILLSALAAGGFLFFVARGSLVYQYRFALALLCFALSMVSYLMLYGKVQFTGTWGHNTLVVAGPASMWLVSLVAFTHIFPDNSSIITFTPPPQGEMTYEAWLKQLHAVAPVFRQTEEDNVASLLSNVYYPGYEHVKPSQPIIKDLLVYFANGQALEISRIDGRNESGKAEIFHYERSTFLTSSLSARAFVAHGNKFEIVNNLSARRWHPAPVGEDFNWYLVVLYFEKVEDADYVVLDTPKYLDTAKKEGAAVDFGLVSARPIRDIRAWEVIPAQLAQGGEVPLLFKEWNDVPRQSAAPIIEAFKPFLQWLEQQRGLKDSVDPSFFAELSKLVGDDTKQGSEPLPVLFNESASLSNARLLHLSNVRNSMVFTYQFGQ